MCECKVQREFRTEDVEHESAVIVVAEIGIELFDASLDYSLGHGEGFLDSTHDLAVEKIHHPLHPGGLDVELNVFDIDEDSISDLEVKVVRVAAC